MNFNLKEGIRGFCEIVVTHEATAASYGSGLVEVFATPAMIALMEKTCHESIQHLLPEGYISVGTEVSIKHLKATSKGRKVWCESKLSGIEGRKLIFSVEAWDEEGKTGAGTHERFIVHRENFIEKLGKGNQS